MTSAHAAIERLEDSVLPGEERATLRDRMRAHEVPGLSLAVIADGQIALERAYGTREAFDADLADAIAATQPDWVLCAGYMRILGEAFIERFRGRLLNIHPSLLPKYRGLRTHARALQDGEREHGASMHFVTPELDAGAVIAQAVVPVAAGDTAESLGRRVLAREHPLLLAVLRLAVAGRIAEREASVTLDGHALFTPLLLDSTGLLHPTA